MNRFTENGPSGRLYMFMGPHTAFAEMDEDHRLAELARHEPSDREAAIRMRRAARSGRFGVGPAIAAALRNLLEAALQPRRMP